MLTVNDADAASGRRRGLRLLSALALAAVLAVPLGLGSAQAASAAPPLGSCLLENGNGIFGGIGPASSVALDPATSAAVETLTPCSAPLAQPFKDRVPIVSEFGWRIHPITGVRTMHNGTDYAKSGVNGTPIRAIADGVVSNTVTSFATSGTGNMIQLTHDGGFRSTIMHMNAAPMLAKGTRVSVGQIIGYVGATGGVTGPHLHLEIWSGVERVNPRDFLAAAPYLR